MPSGGRAGVGGEVDGIALGVVRGRRDEAEAGQPAVFERLGGGARGRAVAGAGTGGRLPRARRARARRSGIAGIPLFEFVVEVRNANHAAADAGRVWFPRSPLAAEGAGI